jgi:hypothetical protein
MHGAGIFDHRIFGGRGVFGMQLPTEHLDPSRPRPIGPAPGQAVQIGGATPVQSPAQALMPVSNTARAFINTQAPNFRAGAPYPVGANKWIRSQAGALLPVSNTAQAQVPVTRAKQVFEGYGAGPRPVVLHAMTGYGQPPRVLHAMQGYGGNYTAAAAGYGQPPRVFHGFGNPDGLGGLVGFGGR